MVIHNYDFTHIKMIRFHNTLTTLTSSEPNYKFVFHLGTDRDIPLLSCEEEQKDGVFHIYLPNVPTSTEKWSNVIKKQFSMILQIAQKYSTDYLSIVVGGTARKESAAIALHQSIREFIGAMYLIEFCMPDQETREAYERTISPIYRS
jgi:hypothetical protein